MGGLDTTLGFCGEGSFGGSELDEDLCERLLFLFFAKLPIYRRVGWNESRDCAERVTFRRKVVT